MVARLEDVHMNIERPPSPTKSATPANACTPAAAATTKSPTDIRLWLRDEISTIRRLIKDLQAALLDLAEQNAATVMPGFTHLQVAQPVSFGHHLLAYVEMFGRDDERMADCRRRTNRIRWAPPHWPAPPSPSAAKPPPHS